MQVLAMQSIPQLNHIAHLWQQEKLPAIITLIICIILLWFIIIPIDMALDNTKVSPDAVTVISGIIAVIAPLVMGTFIMMPNPFQKACKVTPSKLIIENSPKTIIPTDKHIVINHHQIKIDNKHMKHYKRMERLNSNQAYKCIHYYVKSTHLQKRINHMKHYDTHNKYTWIGKPQWYNY